MSRNQVSFFRQNLSIKLMELGNLLIAGIIINQILGQLKITLQLTFAGYILGMSFYVFSYFTAKLYE